MEGDDRASLRRDREVESLSGARAGTRRERRIARRQSQDNSNLHELAITSGQHSSRIPHGNSLTYSGSPTGRWCVVWEEGSHNGRREQGLEEGPFIQGFFILRTAS